MPAVQGWRGQARLANTVMTVHRWSMDWRADLHDVTSMKPFNAASAGQAQFRGGIMDVDVSLDLFHDPAEDPFNAGVANAIVPGATIAARLDLDSGNAVTSLSYLFPAVLVVSAREDSSVRDVARISVMGKVTVARLAAVARATAVLQFYNYT